MGELQHGFDVRQRLAIGRRRDGVGRRAVLVLVGTLAVTAGIGGYLAAGDEGSSPVVQSTPTVSRSVALASVRPREQAPSPFSACGPHSTWSSGGGSGCAVPEAAQASAGGEEGEFDLPVRTQVAPLLTKIARGDLRASGDAAMALRGCFAHGKPDSESIQGVREPDGCSAGEVEDLVNELDSAMTHGLAHDSSPDGVRAYVYWLLERHDIRGSVRELTAVARANAFGNAIQLAIELIHQRGGQDPDLVALSAQLRESADNVKQLMDRPSL